MKKRTQVGLATAFSLLCAATSSLYISLITEYDHSDMDQGNTLAFLLPTWSIAAFGIAASLFAVGIVAFAVLAARKESSAPAGATETKHREAVGTTETKLKTSETTTAKPAGQIRAATSQFWTDHDEMRAHRRIDGSYRVVWQSNNADAGWLEPNPIGEWDVHDTDREVGQAPSIQIGMEMLKQHVRERHGR